jgi:polyketide biosynthesis enoyl-CoA hydratase PksI
MSDRVTTSELGGGIVRVTLDDPAHKNCLNASSCAEIIAVLDRLQADPRVKVLILTGTREVFCAGGTLETVQQFVAGEVSPVVPLLAIRLVSFPLPVIAAMEGSAAGGGLMLALFCDILIASAEKRYGFNFTNLGFTPGDGATALLPALVGHQRASEMLFTAKYYKGRELRESGLFAHVVPQGEVMGLSLDIARRIAEKPRHVLSLLKEELSLPRRRALPEGMFRERLLHQICASRPETAALIENSYTDWVSAKPREE